MIHERRTRLRVGARVVVLIATSALGFAALPALTSSAAVLANYAVSATPSTASAATTGTFNVTFTNNNPLGSLDTINTAKVTFPSGFTAVSAPSSVTGSNGGSWSVSTSGNTVTLSGSAGPSVSVTVPVTTKAPSAPGSYVLTTQVTGGINGVFGQPFDRTGSDPTITVGPGAAAQLVFGQQPTTTQAGKAMSPAVTVIVKDAVGNVVTNYSTPVSLSASLNPNTGGAQNPSGLPVSATPSNGVASFNNIVINDVGVGYRIKATSGSLSSADSQSFDVAGVVKPCPANTTCDSGLLTIKNDTSVDVVDNSGANNDVFAVTLGGSDSPPCATGGPTGHVATYVNNDGSRTLTVTQRLDKSLVLQLPDNGTPHYVMCYESAVSDSNGHAWVTASGQPAAVTSDGLFYYGNLADCSAVNNVAPCLQSLGKNTGDEVAVIKSLPGDPKSIFGIVGG
jgi:hypothetical protein